MNTGTGNTIKLNCDLGEGMGDDAAIMALIDQANIACGGHAGDTESMQYCCALAVKHQVVIGAHPSYPDHENFGRVSMAIDTEDLIASLEQQVDNLALAADSAGATLRYIKPHGALYNDMMQRQALRVQLMQWAAGRQLPLMLLAGPHREQHQQEAERYGAALVFEAFADRRYQDNGLLAPRSESGAVLNHQQALAQAQQLLSTGEISTVSGLLVLRTDSLCVHGDNPAALASLRALRAWQNKQ